MIRIDDEKGEKGRSSSILSLLEKTMLRSDAWNKKMGAHASTLEMELMHEAEKQGSMHHFSSERGPAEPQSRAGLRTIPRKPNEIGFDTQTSGRQF